MNLTNLLLLATDVATDGASTQTPMQSLLGILGSVLPFALIIVVFYFFLIRPQKKQQKETEQMRSSIQVGDQVTTIGGIVGTVRQVKDDGEVYVIETGANNDRLTIRKWAIQSKDTISE
jgi:preprotein translocase subunit YajC